jgi:hypothetical protein
MPALWVFSRSIIDNYGSTIDGSWSIIIALMTISYAPKFEKCGISKRSAEVAGARKQWPVI